MDDFDKASRDWDITIRNLAADFVRRGFAPYEALKMAREEVQRKRFDKWRDEKEEP